jgi:hypothetical protein
MSQEAKHGTDWSSDELDLIVADYLVMLADQLAGRRYVKSQHNLLLLRERIGRTRGSVEFKYENVSACPREARHALDTRLQASPALPGRDRRSDWTISGPRTRNAGRPHYFRKTGSGTAGCLCAHSGPRGSRRGDSQDAKEDDPQIRSSRSRPPQPYARSRGRAVRTRDRASTTRRPVASGSWK